MTHGRPRTEDRGGREADDRRQHDHPDPRGPAGPAGLVVFDEHAEHVIVDQRVPLVGHGVTSPGRNVQ
jgi:hypothetical protein